MHRGRVIAIAPHGDGCYQPLQPQDSRVDISTCLIHPSIHP